MTKLFLMSLLIVATLLLGQDVLAKDTPPTPRTLDEINIEGAVDVPQVLFITSRDNVRFDDDMGWFFLPTAAEILKSTVLPVEVIPEEFPELSKPGEPTARPDAKE